MQDCSLHIENRKLCKSNRSSAIIPPVSTAKHIYFLPPSCLSKIIDKLLTSYSLIPRQNLTGLTFPSLNSTITLISYLYRNIPEVSIPNFVGFSDPNRLTIVANEIPFWDYPGAKERNVWYLKEWIAHFLFVTGQLLSPPPPKEKPAPTPSRPRRLLEFLARPEA